MKSSKKKTAPESASSPAAPQATNWPIYLGLALAALALFEIYRPALQGPFLFDDLYLPFLAPNFAQQPLWEWVNGVRPVLNVTYWMSHRISGLNPYAFHLASLLLHAACGYLVWVVTGKLMEGAADGRNLAKRAAAFAAAVFLVHPMQTESVSYIASRSELVSGLFFLSAWAVFLTRKEPVIGFGRSLVVLLLFALALASKEHTIVLPAALLLSDYHRNRDAPWQAIRRNWRLYGPMLLGAVVGTIAIFRLVLSGARTAGFGVAGLSPLDYLFTQFRSIVKYAWMFVLPIGQNIDHDFPVSRSLADHGSWFCLLLLVAALGLAAWFRKRVPLTFLGLLLFLVLLAPTSSIVPIQDVFVERRMYLPMIGLVLIAADAVQRIPTGRTSLPAVMAVICLGFMAATWQRNQVWSSSIALWSDTANASPKKFRPRFQLAYALYESGDCQRASEQYAAAANLGSPNYELYVDWALAADCASRPADAVRLLTEALRLEKSAHAYALLGMMHGKQGEHERALAALAAAESINPRFATTFLYRGNIFLMQRKYEQAEQAFAQALKLEPSLQAAAEALQRARAARLREEAKPAAERSRGAGK